MLLLDQRGIKNFSLLKNLVKAKSKKKDILHDYSSYYSIILQFKYVISKYSVIQIIAACSNIQVYIYIHLKFKDTCTFRYLYTY